MKSLGPNEQAVLGVLKRHSKPQSAYDILGRLSGSGMRAAVQVYRALDKLSEQGLVHRLECLNAFVACHCDHGTSSPGFTLCTCCGEVNEFDAGKTVSAVQSRLKEFRIDQPSLELKGLCAHCQAEHHTHRKQV